MSDKYQVTESDTVEQLSMALNGLLSISEPRRMDTCTQCDRTKTTLWGEVDGEPVCQGCLRKFAALVIEFAK